MFQKSTSYVSVYIIIGSCFLMYYINILFAFKEETIIDITWLPESK